MELYFCRRALYITQVREIVSRDSEKGNINVAWAVSVGRPFSMDSHISKCLDSILKSRDITLATKVHLWFFPVVMYGCESWIIKKAKR